MTPLAHALVAHAPERHGVGHGLAARQLDGREMPNDGDLVDVLADWVPDAAVRNRILTQNAKALYGFK